MNVSLVVNPVAGNRAYKFIDQIEALLQTRVSLNTFITRKKGDAYAFAKDVQKTDRIIVASGDGTVNEVINGLCSSERSDADNIPIALIPLGITNVLARETGIPDNIERAVDIAVKGDARKISLGRINGRFFSLMAGMGFDGETVLGVRNNMIKKISGKGAHVISGINVLMKYAPPLITVKTPNGEITGYTVIISNAKCYGGDFQVTPDADITEPALDVCVFQGNTRKDLVRFISGVIRKTHLDYEDVIIEKTPEAEVTSSGDVHIQIDGDYYGTLPAKIDVVRDAVSLVC